MQEHTNAKEELKSRRPNPIHIIDGQRLGPASADALRDVHMSLVRAEQNLYNLVQANQAANGSLAHAGFGYAAAQPFTSGFAPGFAPGYGPGATLQAPGPAWGQATPWTPTGVPSWTPLAPGLATPIVAPGFPTAAFAPAAIRASAAGIIACDILDEGKHFVCQLDLPGLRADQVDLLCSERTVVVSATREPESDVANLVQSERAIPMQQRTITLPNEIVPTAVKASLGNGVLTIVLPKADPTEGPRRVKVQG